MQAILATQGAQRYGSGTIVVTNAQFGAQYQNNTIGVQAAVQAAFLSFLAPYVSPTVVVTQPAPQIHEPGVGAFFYRDANGHALVHVVNYDYNDATDQFIAKTNIQVQVQVGSQAVNAVILRSPDVVGAQPLPFTQSAGAITVTVPQVYAWDVLYFETSTRAPAVNSATPATALGAVGGDSLTFSVQASDADGNPLTYTWSVNGQVVAGALAPSYTLQLPVTASGVYIVTVSISDGARVTQSSWTLNVAASRLPTVLFDETHREPVSIAPAPGSPNFDSLALLAQAMQPYYQAARLTAGSITAQASKTDSLFTYDLDIAFLREKLLDPVEPRYHLLHFGAGGLLHKVTGDGRGQGGHQADADQHQDYRNEPAPKCGRRNVSVAHRGSGDDRPPDAVAVATFHAFPAQEWTRQPPPTRIRSV